MTAEHNIPPVWDERSRILILGSFPSVKSREGQFFYHHPRNRFWRVLAAVLGCEVPGTIPEKKAMLLAHGVALWDVIASCDETEQLMLCDIDLSEVDSVRQQLPTFLRLREDLYTVSK